ncbi:MAG: hypothetical protein JSS49_15005 [Planctomycetes bacterium]|nr:hypothetical protein [Planctomycetota bacterium]
MRRFVVLTASILCATLVTAACSADPVTTSGARARMSEPSVLQALHKKIKVQWTDRKLNEILDLIADEAEINLWVDTSALSEEGLTLESEVSLDLGETSIWTALDFLFQPVGLTWTASDGVLEVTTRAKVEEQLTTRVYDVSSLVTALELDFRNLEFRQCLRRWGPLEQRRLGVLERGFDGGMGMGSFGRQSVDNGVVVGDTRILGEPFLKKVLQSSCDVKWMEIDQEGGEICCVRGRLIVRQTFSGHQKIQGILAAAEDFLVKGVKAKSLEIRRPAYPIDEDAAILRQLAEPATLNVSNQSLAEVIQQIATSAGIRHWLDEAALNDEGISVDVKVSANSSGVPLNVILKHLIEPYGLSIIVHEGTLVVTTDAKANEQQELVVYEIGGIPSVGPNELIASIEQATSGTWMRIDQEGGEIELLGLRLLLIRQNSKVHSEIARLLDDLRKSPGLKLEPSKPLEQRIYPVADLSALPDLVRSLPTLIPNWDPKAGAPGALGQCLVITQPAIVHDRIAEIIGALNSAHARLHPRPVSSVTIQAPANPIVSAPVKSALPQSPSTPDAATPASPKPAEPSKNP